MFFFIKIKKNLSFFFEKKKSRRTPEHFMFWLPYIFVLEIMWCSACFDPGQRTGSDLNFTFNIFIKKDIDLDWTLSHEVWMDNPHHHTNG
jgi:hypothetical protein